MCWVCVDCGVLFAVGSLLVASAGCCLVCVVCSSWLFVDCCCVNVVRCLLSVVCRLVIVCVVWSLLLLFVVCSLLDCACCVLLLYVV